MADDAYFMKPGWPSPSVSFFGFNLSIKPGFDAAPVLVVVEVVVPVVLLRPLLPVVPVGRVDEPDVPVRLEVPWVPDPVSPEVP